MAVATVNAVITDMMLVAELHRLCSFNPGSSIVSGTVYLGDNPQKGRQEEDRSENACLGKCVCTAMKNLRHDAP
jgi:hypothetical protein